MAGVALGLPLSLASARIVRQQLFGLNADDPLTYAGALLAVGSVVILSRGCLRDAQPGSIRWTHFVASDIGGVTIDCFALPGLRRGRMESMARKPQANKREAILNAMLDVVAERGFHEAPMSLVSERSGASAGVIYHHFENKEQSSRPSMSGSAN